MTNPFHDNPLATIPADVEWPPVTRTLEGDDLGGNDEEHCRNREDDDKAAQIAHAYGAVFAEVLYCDLPEWALQELSCS